MYTLGRLTKEVNDVCHENGVKGNVSVEINGRLRTTLGRCDMKCYVGGTVPYKIEFSKNFIETATDEQIHEVLLHEATHYIVTYCTKEHHGHDAVFKEYCKKTHCTNDKGVYSEIIYKPQWKYEAICSKCGKTTGRWMRAGKIVKNPQLYESKCCHAPIEIHEIGE